MGKYLETGYQTVFGEYRPSFSRAGAYTCIVLVLLGAGLDYGLYPDELFLFAIARLICACLVFFIILIMGTGWGKDKVEILSFGWLLLPQIMITWMIGVTDGAASMYSIGLYLAIFASSMALPFSFWHNIALSIITFLLYLIACYLHPDSFVLHGVFVVNSLFLLFVITVSAVATYFNERTRYMLFRYKTELANKNRELEETNKSLTDIKGHMLQQEKMAAIGTLSAGLLHEVNNPVNYCLMAIDLAMEEPVAKSNALLSECLLDARQGMKRVQHIVSDLKTFAYRSKDSAADGSDFVFEKAVDSAIRLIGYETKGIGITCNLPPDTMVRGDEAAIIGVLINLLDNAVTAMRKADCTAPAIHLSAIWKNDRLHVTVQDNGPGIAPENLARVFEPFFTTREIGRGLGLGLSISYGVIKRHGGTLLAESTTGEGTRMIFDLPRAAI